MAVKYGSRARAARSGSLAISDVIWILRWSTSCKGYSGANPECGAPKREKCVKNIIQEMKNGVVSILTIANVVERRFCPD